MNSRATGRFEITSWDEDEYDPAAQSTRLARATVSQTFSGDVEGEGSVIYLMAYASESWAQFVGQQRISGTIDGRTGTFVLHLSGTYDGEKAEAEWSVVPGSATEELSGLRGTGSFSAPLGGTATFELDYEFE